MGDIKVKNNYKIALCISLVLFGAVFIFSYYMDLKSLTVWTTNIWDTFFHTHGFRNYYEYSAMNLYGLDHAMVGSDILIYLPWAVWNLPIWALQYFLDIHIIEHAWMLLYSKLFLLVITGGVLFLAKEIGRFFTTDESALNRMVILAGTSFFILTAVGYVGQNDVVVIAPFLLAILNLLKKNKWKFFLWAALSIAFKPFFLFSYVAVILLFEKELIKIGLYSLLGFSIYFLQKIPFLGAPSYTESISYGPTKGAFGAMLKYVLDVPPAGASLFFLGMGIICLMAYLHSSQVLEKEYVLYYSVAPLLIFFMFTRYEFYRPIYLVPLLYLLMLCKPRLNRTNLLLEMAMTGALMTFYMMDEILFYNPHYMLIPSENLHFQTISEWLTSKLPGFGYTAFTAVFLLAMALLLIVNHPRFMWKNPVLEKEEESWLVVVRSMLFALPALLAFLLRCTYVIGIVI